MNAYDLAECRLLLRAAGHDDVDIDMTEDDGFKIIGGGGVYIFIRLEIPPRNSVPVWVSLEALFEDPPAPEYRRPRDAVASWIEERKA